MLQGVTFPSYVKIVECGARDGLQNIKVCDCYLINLILTMFYQLSWLSYSYKLVTVLSVCVCVWMLTRWHK